MSDYQCAEDAEALMCNLSKQHSTLERFTAALYATHATATCHHSQHNPPSVSQALHDKRITDRLRGGVCL